MFGQLHVCFAATESGSPMSLDRVVNRRGDFWATWQIGPHEQDARVFRSRVKRCRHIGVREETKSRNGDALRQGSLSWETSHAGRYRRCRVEFTKKEWSRAPFRMRRANRHEYDRGARSTAEPGSEPPGKAESLTSSPPAVLEKSVGGCFSTMRCPQWRSSAALLPYPMP